MAKFNFKFESIVKVKEILEKKIAKEIAEIEMEINALASARNKLMIELAELRAGLTSRNRKVLELKSAKEYCKLLEAKIANYENEISKLSSKKETKRQELEARKKEKKILETLKENQLEEFLKEENSIEMKEINEIAVRNYARKIN